MGIGRVKTSSFRKAHWKKIKVGSDLEVVEARKWIPSPKS
jgi:hypothetical protein